MAKIDTSKIDGYQNMTAEEKLAALEGFEYEDNSAELEKHKNLLSKANSDVASYKKKYNALLDDDKKKQEEDKEERESMLKELEELRREKKVSDYKSKLISQSFDESLAEKAASALVDGDMDTYFACHKEHNTAFEKKLKADILKDTSTLDEGGASEGMTLEKFKKLSSAERLKFSTENPEEYKKLYGGN